MKAAKRFERRVARRAFVRSGVVEALGIPAWIHVAFGKNACPPGKQKPAGMFMRDLRWNQLVAGAFARAASAAKPLLVLVAKQHDWQRAHAFGELLNHGRDEALALLGLCEVVCAPVAAARRRAGLTAYSVADGHVEQELGAE